MLASKQVETGGRRKPLLYSCALVLLAGLSLSGCVSGSGKDAVAELMDPDPGSVDAVKKKPLTAEERLAQAATPTSEYQAAQAANGSQPAADSPPATASAAQAPNMQGVVMQGTGINASRSSIFSSAPPATAVTAPLPASSAEAAYAGSPQAATPSPAGIKATSASVFSASGKNPLLSSTNNSADGSEDTAEMEADDVPLILRGKLYSSTDLAPDPHEAPANDMVTLAALPSLTRQAVTGFLIQRPDVEVGCFKPNLVGLLKRAEDHFGKRLVITSGHRSLQHNIAVGGAKHSKHLTCDAADIQMVGVSKWDLAKYFRSQPDVGGVGTYCSTASIHVDTGRRRDWNWKCRADTAL